MSNYQLVQNILNWGGGEGVGRRVLLYMGHSSIWAIAGAMCGPEWYGILAVLVKNMSSVLASLVHQMLIFFFVKSYFAQH